MELTDAGRELVDQALTQLLDIEHQVVAALTPEQRAAGADILRTLTHQFDNLA